MTTAVALAAVLMAATVGISPSAATPSTVAGGGSMASMQPDQPVPPDVLAAIRDAAQKTGGDPVLMLAFAWKESRFDPSAQNAHSSAHGLLQFTSQTWLETIRDFGAQHGLGHYASLIRQSGSGELFVSDGSKLKAILRLRADPRICALMAAERLIQQRAVLEDDLGRPATRTDLYLLHLLGTNGAKQFLTAASHQPAISSLKILGSKALANPGLFIQRGRALTVAEVYAHTEAMLDARRHQDEMLLAMADQGSSEPVEVAQAP